MSTYPPTEDALVSPDAGFDGPYVIRNFLGKTQVEARKMYSVNYAVTEDFTYMAPGGLRYYLPPAFDYLRDEESEHNWEFCCGLLCALSSRVQFFHALPADVVLLIKDIASYASAHRDKFDIDENEKLFNKYVRKISDA